MNPGALPAEAILPQRGTGPMQEEDRKTKSPDVGGIRLLTTPIEGGEDRARTTIVLDERHEGWTGVPHGGVLMSLVLELAHHGMDRSVFSSEGFPIRTSFRWGGPTVFLGDSLEIEARREGEETRVTITKEGEETPSFSVSIRSMPSPDVSEPEHLDTLTKAMEAIGRDTKDNVLPLPYATNCFVCGTEREHPGLTRKFFCLDAKGQQIVFTSIGLDPDDQNRVFRFQLDDAPVHPGVLAAILDETMGWGGFVKARHGGMTVKLDIDFLRPVERGEKMVCYGLCSGTRGKSATRMFWFAEGGILPMGEGDLPPILRASGQWLAMPDLTEEMRKHLRPSDWLDRWFAP
jgi:acyl-coenzyme A thioesterase PaaI-like protein